MNAHIDKTSQNKSQAVSNILSKERNNSQPAFQFEDNRPEAVAQRKLKEIVNNSAQVQQLKACAEMANDSPGVKQLRAYQFMADSFSSQAAQRKESSEEEALQGKPEPVQKKKNNTGLPDNLKSGIENLSGYTMDNVKVHYNSDKPAQLQAHAYAQGTDIHLASGQEKHLAHEAWHVVQQKQGRVKPTLQLKDKLTINDDAGLENEADVMGAKASNLLTKERSDLESRGNPQHEPVVQRVLKLGQAHPGLIGQPGFSELTALINEFNKSKDPSMLDVIARTLAPFERIDPVFYNDMMQQMRTEIDKIPFVELGPDVKEKKARVKTGLLGEALEADEKIRKKKSEKNRAPSREAQYLFHSTTYKNLITIYQNGLDPNKGGSAIGASALADGKLKEDSLKGSKGFVHGATQSEVALHYAGKFDKKEKEKNVRDVGGFSVALRFRVIPDGGWTEDTEDSRGNYKTPEIITPDMIEYLDAGGGWLPLQSINFGELTDLVHGTQEQNDLMKGVTILDLSKQRIAEEGIDQLLADLKGGKLPTLEQVIFDRKQLSSVQEKKFMAPPNKVRLKIIDHETLNF